MLPVVDPAGRAVVLATVDGRPFTTAELMDSWARLNPLERPRVSTANQVRDLVRNALFERALRAEAARGRLARRPDIAQALAREREYVAVEHLVAREVYGRIDTTSAALQRFYRDRASEWALPTRVRLIELTLTSRRSADSMAVRLVHEAEAESLATRAERRGVRYLIEVTEEGDSAYFQRALQAGAGAVVGPDATEDGWRVARVREVVPPRMRSFAEARSLVAQRWYGDEGERLMLALLDRVRRSTSVVVNERELAKIRPS